MSRVMISMPTYDGTVFFQAAQAMWRACRDMSPHGIQHVQHSALAKGFNILWVKALSLREKGFTHFAMQHADIIPEEYWLDKMLAISEETKADILSVVMALKSGHGLTSTGIDTDDKYRPRRFTMRQLPKLPEAFTHEKLVVNTGLMLVDIRKPWVDLIRFHMEDAIVDGKAEFVPEDWLFSREARALGAKIYATTAVKADHIGRSSYPNHGGWGDLEVDSFNGEAVL